MTSPQRIACMTMVKNDVEFLDIWVRYYSKLFGAEHCYIVDHGSDDTTAVDRARALGAQVIRLPHTYPAAAPEGKHKGGATIQFDRYRFSFLSKLRVALREFYDVVIFHDVDEVMLADPARYADLADYLTSNADRLKTHAILGGAGVEIFHDPMSEASYDATLPVLSQRSNAHFRLVGCKPAIFRSDEPGQAHGASIPFALDPDLWLLHLKFLDRDLMTDRQKSRHAAVQRGEVPSFTRWSWADNEVDDKFKAFLARPVDPDESRGRRFLEENFRRGKDGSLVVNRRAKKLPGQPYRATAGMKIAAGTNLDDFRFVVPKRYSAVV